METHKLCGKWLRPFFSPINLLFGCETACFPCMTADSETEIFTVWMKSLIMQGNGLTVYNGNGQIVYRMDNYDEKRKSEVFLTDLCGKLLFTIRRKRSWFMCHWEGYENTERRPSFGVKKVEGFFSKKLRCDVKLCAEKSKYRLEGFWGKTAFRILDSKGGLVAEAKRKQSSLGVELGEDVLSLMVKKHSDYSLIVALVTVYLLIQQKM